MNSDSFSENEVLSINEAVKHQIKRELDQAKIHLKDHVNTADKTSPSSSTSEEVVRSKTEITIPLKKEDIVVEKKPYVKEEIIIKKKPVSETKTISEQLITEKVSVKNAAGEEVTEEKEGRKGQEE